MARSPEQKALRAGYERARRARGVSSGASSSLDEVAFLRDQLRVKDEHIAFLQRRLEASEVVHGVHVESMQKSTLVHVDSSFLPAVDASHNRAHALSDSESLLGSYMYENKEGTPSLLSGKDNLNARVSGLECSHVDSVDSPRLVHVDSPRGSTVWVDPKVETRDQEFYSPSRGKRVSMAPLPNPKTDGEAAEIRRKQAEAALRWAAEQEQKGAAE